ncbi:MAG: hypothetical protein J5J00_03430, partial [Deltaproteobacteria bacterium]|nr:hypothetical protein [Deltaproteobacteria bacterium]
RGRQPAENLFSAQFLVSSADADDNPPRSHFCPGLSAGAPEKQAIGGSGMTRVIKKFSHYD